MHADDRWTTPEEEAAELERIAYAELVAAQDKCATSGCEGYSDKRHALCGTCRKVCKDTRPEQSKCSAGDCDRWGRGPFCDEHVALARFRKLTEQLKYKAVRIGLVNPAPVRLFLDKRAAKFLYDLAKDEAGQCFGLQHTLELDITPDGIEIRVPEVPGYHAHLLAERLDFTTIEEGGTP